MQSNNLKIDKKILGERLKQLLTDNNDTIYTIAEITHLSSATISRYINGIMAPKITTIEVIARHYNVNPTWLMGYNVPKFLEKKLTNPEDIFENPDIMLIARAGKKMTPDQVEKLKRYIEFEFPEVFNDIDK